MYYAYIQSKLGQYENQSRETLASKKNICINKHKEYNGRNLFNYKLATWIVWDGWDPSTLNKSFAFEPLEIEKIPLAESPLKIEPMNLVHLQCEYQTSSENSKKKKFGKAQQFYKLQITGITLF